MDLPVVVAVFCIYQPEPGEQHGRPNGPVLAGPAGGEAIDVRPRDWCRSWHGAGCLLIAITVSMCQARPTPTWRGSGGSCWLRVVRRVLARSGRRDGATPRGTGCRLGLGGTMSEASEARCNAGAGSGNNLTLARLVASRADIDSLLERVAALRASRLRQLAAARSGPRAPEDRRARAQSKRAS